VPLMRKRFVEDLKWIEEEEMLDIVSLSQSTPGPIAVNASLMTGYRIAGIPGALLSVLGTTLPPLIIISIISFFYAQFRDNVYVSNLMLGMQAGVAAVICSVVFDLGKNVVKGKDLLSILIMCAVFALVYFVKINVIFIIIACALIGILRGVIHRKRIKGGNNK